MATSAERVWTFSTPKPLPPRTPPAALPNVIPTPHCAGGDDENIIKEIEIFFANIHRALAAKLP